MRSAHHVVPSLGVCSVLCVFSLPVSEVSDSPAEVPLHQCTQHGKEAGGCENNSAVQLENHDMIATTEVWWDGSHNCYTGTEGYKLFRKDGQGRSVRAPLYVMEGIGSKEMLLRNSHGWVDNLCVIVKGWINNGHLEVGVYYRSPD